jgi:lipoprotein-releasing system permease protein
LSTSWFIAKRYLQAHRRNGFLSFITTIAILGVTLGTAALIITLSVLDGFEREIKEKVVGFTSHIEIVGFQNVPLPYHTGIADEVKAKITGVKSIAPYAAKEGMIRSKEGVDGVFLKGIDVELGNPIAQQHIVEGKFLAVNHGNIPEIVIGRKLANRLNANVGEKLVVFALPGERSQSLQPKAKQFQLVGIYESGMAEFDDIYAYTLLGDAQQLFQLGNDITGYDIFVNDISTVDHTATEMQDMLGYPHYARTVFQSYRNLFSWVELQKKLSPLLLSLIIIVATINIIGTLLMFVLEKAHAIGVLKSLGASPRLIQRIFLLQGLVIAIVGIVVGNLLAFVLCWTQMKFHLLSLPSDIYYMNTVPILIRPENFLIVTVVAFVLCFVTTLLPSRASAKLDPLAIFRYG